MWFLKSNTFAPQRTILKLLAENWMILKTSFRVGAKQDKCSVSGENFPSIHFILKIWIRVRCNTLQKSIKLKATFFDKSWSTSLFVCTTEDERSRNKNTLKAYHLPAECLCTPTTAKCRQLLQEECYLWAKVFPAFRAFCLCFLCK